MRALLEAKRGQDVGAGTTKPAVVEDEVKVNVKEEQEEGKEEMNEEAKEDEEEEEECGINLEPPAWQVQLKVVTSTLMEWYESPFNRAMHAPTIMLVSVGLTSFALVYCLIYGQQHNLIEFWDVDEAGTMR